MQKKSFFAGILVAILAFGLIGTAYATVGKRSIDVDYTDIKILLDGVPLEPTDANGQTVEPFAYNGTTFLPVRAIGEALDMEVGWDGATHTVVLDPKVNQKELVRLWNINRHCDAAYNICLHIVIASGFGSTSEGLKQIEEEITQQKERWERLGKFYSGDAVAEEALAYYKGLIDYADSMRESMINYKMSNRSEKTFEALREKYVEVQTYYNSEVSAFFIRYLTEANAITEN